ncbi:MAG TPA: molybdopterin-dependent oxidoreductase [bacterium]|nr:molybdopterin-dependent oxidoreductase [bacterium]HQI48741.1 molybdopterin-dependent oxidoreductase [bacterium]HQJ65228.1 molybdopterin-dependent oxidoreductase [bacterium]
MNLDSVLHLRGESQFIDDRPAPAGTLHAAVFTSPVARGRLIALETTAAAKAPGVCAVLTAADIPGENQIGGIIADELLLAAERLDYIGQPVALIVAASPEAARAALKLMDLSYAEETPVLDPREAVRCGELIQPPRTFAIGNIDHAWAHCDFILEGRADSGGQEHLYLETQGALALPEEQGGIKLFSATQSPTTVQKSVARVLGLAMHQVEVEVLRLGGAFGGKEDQATAWAALAALAAFHLGKPVKLILRRHEDMRCTGKRHPYSSDYRIGLRRDGKILAWEVTYYQNAGAAADLSPAILDRTLFHATNCYAIPHVRATAWCCRTNLPPNTAFRGFGGPQAMFVLEAALDQAAARLGLPVATIQAANLIEEGNEFPYGQRGRHVLARRCWQELHERYDPQARRAAIDRFNATHRHEKRGMAIMPICFGISFTNTLLNQANALVHIYSDGSVGISTGAVEMGQGVHEKLRSVAARALGIRPGRIRIESTSTVRNANTSATAASTGADLNGQAVRLACESILARLADFAARIAGIDSPGAFTIRREQIQIQDRLLPYTWEGFIAAAYAARISLSSQAHYATPAIHFDKTTNKGDAFAYHVYGAALIEATLDVLRGTCRFDAVRIVHDAGRSLDPQIDRGQVEGGVVQGLGWMTLEEVVQDTKGRLLAGSMTTYKVPDLFFAPAEIEIHWLEEAEGGAGPYHSKAIGEPPLLYGIGGWFALLDALRAARPGLELPYVAPLTSERLLMALHGGDSPA